MKAKLIILASFFALCSLTPVWAAKGPNAPVISDAITLDDENSIIQMREEEKLARDVYITLYNFWHEPIFLNISESEQRHMDAMKRLITKYNILDPVVSDEVGAFSDSFLGFYNSLVEEGMGSLEAAFGVGVQIEEMDIADIEEILNSTNNASLTRVLSNLLEGSLNHLNAFNSHPDSN